MVDSHLSSDSKANRVSQRSRPGGIERGLLYTCYRLFIVSSPFLGLRVVSCKNCPKLLYKHLFINRLS